MPKDNREIRRAVVLDGETYVSGMEDELDKALSAEQKQTLTNRGAISGFGAKAEAVEETEETESETTETSRRGRNRG